MNPFPPSLHRISFNPLKTHVEQEKFVQPTLLKWDWGLKKSFFYFTGKAHIWSNIKGVGLGIVFGKSQTEFWHVESIEKWIPKEAQSVFLPDFHVSYIGWQVSGNITWVFRLILFFFNNSINLNVQKSQINSRLWSIWSTWKCRMLQSWCKMYGEWGNMFQWWGMCWKSNLYQ